MPTVSSPCLSQSLMSFAIFNNNECKHANLSLFNFCRVFCDFLINLNELN